MLVAVTLSFPLPVFRLASPCYRSLDVIGDYSALLRITLPPFPPTLPCSGDRRPHRAEVPLGRLRADPHNGDRRHPPGGWVMRVGVGVVWGWVECV